MHEDIKEKFESGWISINLEHRISILKKNRNFASLRLLGCVFYKATITQEIYLCLELSVFLREKYSEKWVQILETE